MIRNTPIVSVIMAAFNEELVIGRAIDSILAQSFEEWELVLINDCSTDRTGEIAASYAERDSRIQVKTNKSRMGLAASLNIAIDISAAPLLARADADDVNLSSRLELQLAYMNSHPEVDVLGSGAYLMGSDGNRIRSIVPPLSHAELAKLSFIKTLFFHPSVMIRRRFFDVVGMYDESFRRAQDKELWIRGLRAGSQYANLPIPLIEYDTSGYVRSWRSIIDRGRALLQISYRYRIPKGYFLALVSVTHSILIKSGLFVPRMVRRKEE